MRVVPDRPQTVSDLRNGYGLPLLELTAFACDRPDAISRETYIDPQETVIEIWRQDRPVDARPWRERFLFQASDLRDYPKSIRAWWRLHRKVWPALGLFGDHLLHGNTYSPERFLTTYSALEVYGRRRLRTTDLAALRSFADVDSKLIGCTNKSLKLIGKTRGYFAHFNNVKSDADLREVQDNLMEHQARRGADAGMPPARPALQSYGARGASHPALPHMAADLMRMTTGAGPHFRRRAFRLRPTTWARERWTRRVRRFPSAYSVRPRG
jgi:hypothetical protein